MDDCVEYDLEEISEAVKELERTKKIPEGAFLGGTKVPDAVVKACKTYVDYRQDAQKKVQEYADPSSERLLPDLPVRERINWVAGNANSETRPSLLTNGSSLRSCVSTGSLPKRHTSGPLCSTWTIPSSSRIGNESADGEPSSAQEWMRSSNRSPNFTRW